MSKNIERRWGRAIWWQGCKVATGLGIAISVFGCAGTHLYDESKAKVAKDASDRYGQVKLLDLVDTQRVNLDAILAEELKVVSESTDTQAKLAMMRIAVSDQPMALSLIQAPSIRNRLSELGGENGADLRKYISNIRVLALREHSVQARANIIKVQTGIEPPYCLGPGYDPNGKDWADALAALLPEQREIAELIKPEYDRACAEYAQLLDQTKSAGEFAENDAELRAAKKHLANYESAATLEDARYRSALKNYAEAAQKAKAAETPDSVAELQQRAKDLKAAIDEANQVSDRLHLPVGPELRIGAIDTVLAAAVGGKTDVDPKKDPDLWSAATAAQGVSALAPDIGRLVKEQRAPTLGNLIIAKEGEEFKRQYALTIVAFARQRIALLQDKFNALLMEANELLSMRDNLCIFAEYKAALPGSITCDSADLVAVEAGDSPLSNLVVCKFMLTSRSGASSMRILRGRDCPFALTVREGLAVDSLPARRYLFKAIANYENSISVAARRRDEASYKLINLSHAQAAEYDRMAIQSANALIITPIKGLNAYHSSGIKPAELADLIVKALGFTAITVGVSQ